MLCSLLLIGSITTVIAKGKTHEHKMELLRSLKVCENVRSGNYDIVFRHKGPDQEEIASVRGHCIFSKVPKDQVLGARVELTIRHQNGVVTRNLYDGRYDVFSSSKKGEAVKVSDLTQKPCTYFIAGSDASALLFKPLLPILLFSKKEKNFFRESIQKRAREIRKLPDESVDDRNCHVFVVYCENQKEIKDESLTIFIDHALNIPIKYVHQRIYWDAPTYEEAVISHFTLNNREDPDRVPDALAEIPADNETINTPELPLPDRSLLEIDSVAPLWTLPTVQGGSLGLESLRGKVTLLSFWYKSFEPSLQYLQSLQQLQEKFHGQEFVVVGINLYDPCESLANFLSNRGITYPNLLADQQISNAYKAHTPNTLYLLDKSGKVRYSAIVQQRFPQKILSRKIKKLLRQK